MAIIKCKMCGGDLRLIEGASTAECEFCGSVQTIPKVDDEKKLTLFARANRLRAACEFDKAAGIYEAIVADFPEESEAYWGLVLCRYGIEYVDDPGTGKKIPTCHRSSFESVMEDSDFEQAQENADPSARRIYREEAKQIDEIRKGIIEVSAKEDPYDIFICYKETDESGNRTLDSVLAQDAYDALTEKGYRVFFSRITLEDRLGQEYEPCIFAALNSAKVMLVIGTDYEHFNAVWVKNEWSRYLKLMEKDKDKHLIPCFRGVDAYDMPSEFSKLQAQDLGKVGAMQDLLRGISKLVDVGSATVTQTIDATTVIVDTMLKRAAEAIALHDWEQADRCINNVLDYDYRNEQAYVCRLLISHKAESLSELENQNQSIAADPNFQYLLKNGSNTMVEEMRALEDRIIQKIKAKEEEAARLKKQKTIRRVKTVGVLLAAIALVVAAVFLVQNVVIPGSTYRKAEKMAKNGQYDEAVAVFASLGDFKDSHLKIYETYLQKADSHAENADYAAALEVLISEEVSQLGYGVDMDRQLEYTYLMAKQAYDREDYGNAIEIFSSILDYQESAQYLTDSHYLLAERSYQNGDFATAIVHFNAVGDYKNGAQRALEVTYEVAESCYQSGQFDTAIQYFMDLGDYNNGMQRAVEIAYEVGDACYQNGELDQAISYFSTAGDYEDAADRVVKITYEAGTQCMKNQEYKEAVNYFERVADYADAGEQILKAKFQYCTATKDNPDATTKAYIRELNDMQYYGATALYRKIFAWKAEVRASVSFRIGTQSGVSFYAKMSGGDGSSTMVRFVIITRGQRFEYCDEKKYSAGSEASCQLSHSMQDITGWEFTVNVYDENGELIGTFTGVPS